MDRSESGGESEEVECTEPGCSSEAAVRLHIPWSENHVVCPACARGLVQQEGVVAEPLTDQEDAWS